jgi:hypothetical protein
LAELMAGGMMSLERSNMIRSMPFILLPPPRGAWLRQWQNHAKPPAIVAGLEN